jgi:hypothetical protein
MPGELNVPRSYIPAFLAYKGRIGSKKELSRNTHEPGFTPEP